jgi:DNA-directed RNA polymerase specialized sigma24 family protein
MRLSDERLKQFRREVERSYVQLVGSANRIARRYQWKTKRPLPRGNEGRDLLHTAVELVLAGDRPWPARLPLEAFLVAVMNALAWNLARGREVPLPPNVERLAASAPVSSEHEERARRAELLDEARSAARASPAVEQVLKAILDGALCARFIAEDTGLPVKKVYNTLFALEQRLAPVADRWRRAS